MKTISKILFIILGIIVSICLIILIRASYPSLTRKLSGDTDGLSKNEAVSELKSDDSSNSNIENLPDKIATQEQQDNNSENRKIDLGWVDGTIFSSMDDYYTKLMEVIKSNYSQGSTISFSLLISDSIFQEWYEENQDSINTDQSNVAFSFDVTYEKEDDGCYKIFHNITFE